MSVKINVSEIFASNVFDDATMKQRLPRRFMLNSRIRFLKARTLNHMWLRLSPMR